MADDEHGRPLPSIYDGLPDRRETSHHRSDLTDGEKAEHKRKEKRKMWAEYRAWHPKKKFRSNIVIWIIVFLFYLYFRGSEMAEGRRWGGVVAWAWLFWIIPASNLFEWWKLERKS